MCRLSVKHQKIQHAKRVVISSGQSSVSPFGLRVVLANVRETLVLGVLRQRVRGGLTSASERRNNQITRLCVELLHVTRSGCNSIERSGRKLKTPIPNETVICRFIPPTGIPWVSCTISYRPYGIFPKSYLAQCVSHDR